jgi:hypothetical protein
VTEAFFNVLTYADEETERRETFEVTLSAPDPLRSGRLDHRWG